MLHAGILAFWTNEKELDGSLSDEQRDRTAQQLLAEGMKVVEAVNPMGALREQLVEAVHAAARCSVLAIGPQVDRENQASKGLFLGSGELRAHIAEIVQKDEDLGKAVAEAGPEVDLSAWIYLRYWIALAHANVLATMREAVGDAVPEQGDWYSEFFSSQCQLAEYRFRDLLGMPSSLPGSEHEAFIESMLLASFATRVQEGTPRPDIEWRRRCEEFRQEQAGRQTGSTGCRSERGSVPL
jgi:hypothetical protein